MILKFVIGKIDPQSKTEKAQQFQVLLDKKYGLPTAGSIERIQQKLGCKLTAGNVFAENNQEKYLFAALPKDSSNQLPEEWGFVPFDEINSKLYPDYEAIVKALKKLGYLGKSK